MADKAQLDHDGEEAVSDRRVVPFGQYELGSIVLLRGLRSGVITLDSTSGQLYQTSSSIRDDMIRKLTQRLWTSTVRDDVALSRVYPPFEGATLFQALRLMAHRRDLMLRFILIRSKVITSILELYFNS